MNYGMIRFIMGRFFIILGGLLLIPLLVSFYYEEPWPIHLSFFGVAVFCFLAGLLLSFRAPRKKRVFAREGFVLCSLVWIALSLFGSLPFVFSGYIPRLVDAFFETASGFTTTGASILTNVEALPQSLLFWRSFSHLVGGMGVLVFVLALLPSTESDSSSVYILKAEVPGPTFGKLVSKVKDLSRILYIIYLSMTVVLILALLICGMPLFDSCIHAFGAAGTGGFSSKAASVGYYHSASVDWVLGVGMIVFGVNFNLYYLLLLKQFKAVFQDEELKWYLGIITGACVLLGINLWSQYSGQHGLMVRDIFFTVSSIITTTGYATADFDKWPLFSRAILLGLMFCGACAGSTAGGLKVSRVAILIKNVRGELSRALNPNRVVTVRFNRKPILTETRKGVLNYFAFYVLVYAIAVLAITPSAKNFLSAVSAVAATFNNIGPGFDMVGPTQSYASLSDFAKWVLSLVMIMGRLEILPVFLLFSPRTWRRG